MREFPLTPFLLMVGEFYYLPFHLKFHSNNSFSRVQFCTLANSLVWGNSPTPMNYQSMQFQEDAKELVWKPINTRIIGWNVGYGGIPPHQWIIKACNSKKQPTRWFNLVETNEMLNDLSEVQNCTPVDSIQNRENPTTPLLRLSIDYFIYNFIYNFICLFHLQFC